MDYQSIIDKYKNQPMAKAALVIFTIVIIVKLGTMGFEFGQWLRK
ncbi:MULTISPECIES: hypothetical protein [unclassified Mucilaginibacter]|nr:MULTISPECIES: hypothetical protein [unclassified Mucilaginibacter]MEB0300815.1 hypothetical protein [Mucilaginibacter sp. 5C4]WPX25267.1 hypothetical protein RHM67_08310 [Mucilaginibacter sp. 5C4]